MKDRAFSKEEKTSVKRMKKKKKRKERNKYDKWARAQDVYSK